MGILAVAIQIYNTRSPLKIMMMFGCALNFGIRSLDLSYYVKYDLIKLHLNEIRRSLDWLKLIHLFKWFILFECET